MTKLDHTLTFDEVLQILRVIEAAPRGGELNIQLGDASLSLRLAGSHAGEAAHQAAASLPVVPSPAASAPPKTVAVGESRTTAPASAPQTVTEARPPSAEMAGIDEEKWIAVRSPMVGIFYRASGPGEPPFVEIGDAVEEGQQVGIVEVMKLMNRISSPCPGTVRAICVENAQLAGFDAPLLWIEPQA